MSESAAPLDRRAVLRDALHRLEDMQAKLDAAERAPREPIAVVGLGCRFPGAPGPDAYWRLLTDGVDAIREVPADRWDLAAYYEADPEAPGKMYSRFGGFLDDISLFDADFFGIAPREAVKMDPQHRLVLEVAWEALENGGVVPESLEGSRTGVFVGITGNDYTQLLNLAGPERIDAYHMTGGCSNFSAGRLAYLLGLQGPTMAVDTACSSSLVTVHLACQSLRARECDAALAGGVNVIVLPEFMVALSKARMLAPDGRCKTFDARADGFVRAEGCGLVLLKRLSDALRDEDPIAAVIRGSAVNQDGRSSGLTVPNKLAQEALIRQALAFAAVKPAEVGYVEAHGTGTSLGDPIEVRALAAVLGEGRAAGRPFYLGSAKTNIGHLESAAGVAGLIKVVLALQNEEIPPHLHLTERNPYVAWDEVPAVIPTTRIPWPAGETRRIAGISSFGGSGTNAHLIVEEAPVRAEAPACEERLAQVLCVSAKSDVALRQAAARLEAYLANAAPSLADVCFTANAGRTHFAHRAAVVAVSKDQARQRLAALGAGGSGPGIATGTVSGRGGPRVAFLFTGQGSQYAGMGRELLLTQPTFRRAMQRCEEALRGVLEHPLLSILHAQDGPTGLLDETAYTQPALFALEWSLSELWRSWGVEPSVVLGHSVGEYVAACVAGVFELEDGLRLIAERGRLMQSLPRGGVMASVFADEERVASAVAHAGPRVSIAAVNGPEGTVVSGDAAGVAQVLAEMEKAGVKSRRLTVSHAFHSPLMEPILGPFGEAAARVHYAAPRIDLVSNLTGRPEKGHPIGQAAYWVRHLREPVRFKESMEWLGREGYDLYLEVGPGSTLLGMGRRCLDANDAAWLPSLRKGRGEWEQILESVGALHVRGGSLDWRRFDADYEHRKVALPTYPFQQRRYWADLSRGSRLATRARGAKVAHPLLGGRLRTASTEHIYESTVSSEEPVVREHTVNGRFVLPAAAYLEMALAAGDTVEGSPANVVEDLLITEALVVGPGETRTLQTAIAADGAGASVRVLSLGAAEDDASTPWRLHATARASASAVPSPPAADLASLRRRCPREVAGEDHYAELRARGMEFGPRYRGVERIWLGDGDALGRVTLPSAAGPTAPFRIHPALLDACLQVAGAALPPGGRGTYLPMAVERIRLHRRPEVSLWTHAVRRRGESATAEVVAFDLNVYDDSGLPVLDVDGLAMKRVSADSTLADPPSAVEGWLYELLWEDRPLGAAASRLDGSWLILADACGVGQALAEAVRGKGGYPVVVTAGEAFGRGGEDVWTIDPGQPGDVRRLLAEAGPARSWRGVVHLWGLEGGEAEPTSSALGATAERITASALHVVQALAEVGSGDSPIVWFVTRGAQPVGIGSGRGMALAQTPLLGLGRVVSLEHPELRCRRVDLDLADPPDVDALCRELAATDADDEVALRGGQRLAPTIERMARPRGAPAPAPVRLEFAERGVLENLAVVPSARRAPGPGEVEIRVSATGLNFRDVLNVLGMYPGDAGQLGSDCVGRIVALGEGVADLALGDEVVALAPGGFATYLTAPARFVLRKPEQLDPVQAATTVGTFLTAVYGLQHLARLGPGESVLIHAGAGGVGLSAIQVALRAGAVVFATAGSEEKKEHLRRLGVRHVASSRSVDFAAEIVQATGGAGVDVVLNSLTGDFIPASLSLLRAGGRFLEIGKRDIWDLERVRRHRPGVAYHVFDLLEVAEREPALVRSLLRDLMEAFRRGDLQPLPVHEFPLSEAEAAFRLMAQAKHIGKVVVTQPPAEVSLAIRGDASYLVTGALGGLGLRIARWLSERGAGHLVLFARGEPTEAVRTALREIEAAGTRVTLARGDVTRESDVAAALATIPSSMPLRGIVHAAGTVDDGVLAHLDRERFARVMAPKVLGSWNLHALTLGAPLDFFVLFGSAVSMVGRAGQGNYAAANAFLDGLAHHRRALGRPALAIDWGMWGEVGMAVQGDRAIRMAAQGIGTIPPNRGIEALETLLAGAPAQVAVFPVDWARLLLPFGEGKEPGRFRAMAAEAKRRSSRRQGPDPAAAVSGLRARLLEMPSGKRLGALASVVRDEAAKVLGREADSIDPERPLRELGLDSLMAVELRNALAKVVGESLPATLLFDQPNLRLLGVYLGTRFEAVPQPAVAAASSPPPGVAADVERLEAISDEEAQALLLEELAGGDQRPRRD